MELGASAAGRAGTEGAQGFGPSGTALSGLWFALCNDARVTGQACADLQAAEVVVTRLHYELTEARARLLVCDARATAEKAKYVSSQNQYHHAVAHFFRKFPVGDEQLFADLELLADYALQATELEVAVAGRRVRGSVAAARAAGHPATGSTDIMPTPASQPVGSLAESQESSRISYTEGVTPSLSATTAM